MEAVAPSAVAPGAESATALGSTVRAAPAAAPSPAPAANASARLTRVTAIDWEESSGLTVVVLTGDGAFPAGSFKWNEIRDANPRVLLRLSGMSAGFGKTLLAAGTPELEKVRIGYHEKPTGNELHIVLDLAAPEVKVASVEASGSRLYIRLAKP